VEIIEIFLGRGAVIEISSERALIFDLRHLLG